MRAHTNTALLVATASPDDPTQGQRLKRAFMDSAQLSRPDHDQALSGQVRQDQKEESANWIKRSLVRWSRQIN